MRCHYVKGKNNEKVIIPGCWDVTHSNNMNDCTCKTKSLTFASFEKERYNTILNEKNSLIESLQTEIVELKRQITETNVSK